MVAPIAAREAGQLTHIGVQRARRCPTDVVRMTSPQLGWLNVVQQLAIWRGGNQIGKSFGQAMDIVAFCRGVHPQQTHAPPVRVLVVSYSWEQMDPLLEKLWALLPKDEIDPKVSYEPGSGIRGYKIPHIKFVSGPGAGSVIFFATYKQGSKRIAGGSYHRVYLDEPPPESVYGEIRPRLNRYGGCLRITFTPTPDSPPLDYLRAKVEKGEIHEHHTVLTLDAVTIRGSRIIERPLVTQRQIDAFIADCLDVERAMRVEGSWEPLVTGRWLTNFDPVCISVERPPANATLAVGIDHGTAAGKQAAVLLAIVQRDELAPQVWIVDESQSDGTTKPEDDARAILEMLRRNGWSYGHVDVWMGDRETGRDKYFIKKSNGDLRKQLARLLGVPVEQTKFIETPQKWGGSPVAGIRLINAIMGRRRGDGRSHWLIHPRCTRSIDAYKGFRGDRRDPLKDILDAQRYAVERSVQTAGWFNFRATYR